MPEPSQSDIFTWAELDIRREKRRQQQIEEQRRLKDEPPQPLSPGAALLEDLTREPIVPRPANLSVLVEPAMDYEHRSERFHSRMRHGKSVFRQERLEVIRQAQQRPLPDWRIILQRLAGATPGKDELVVDGVGSSMLLPRLASGLTPSQFLQIYSLSTSPSPSTPGSQQQQGPQQSRTKSQGGHYRKHAVSFALPGDSTSIQELLHGVDGTLWKISKRSGGVLRLYRRNAAALQPPADNDAHNGSNDNDGSTDYSWLLTLSGNKSSIFRAASEVTFFLKDAVPVAVDPNVRLDDLRTEQPSPSESTAELPLPADGESDPQASGVELESSPTQTWSLVSSSYYLDDSKGLADHVFSPHVTDIGAHEIPRPAVWTRESFEHYVAALVNGRPPQHLAAQLYPQSSNWSSKPTFSDDETGNSVHIGSEDAANTAESNPVLNSHDRTVVNLLHDLFDDDAVKDVLSLSAFKLALAFISKHGETYRPEARALFVRAERLRMRMDTETFNILLASLVKTQDLRNFGSTLALMENRGYAPDLTTWVLFLRLFESEEVKRHILHAMQSRSGLLDSPEARQAIAQEMVEYDALRAVTLHRRRLHDMREQNQIYNHSHGDNPAVFLDEFMGGQTERYGEGWLTRPAANQILEVFASHGLFAVCQELLGVLTRKQDRRDRIEQLKMQQKRRQQQQQQQSEKPLQPDQPLRPQLSDDPTDLVAVQALNTTSFNIVLTHAKVQHKLRDAIAIVRQMDGLGYGQDHEGQAQIPAGTHGQDLVPIEASTPTTPAVTRAPPGNRTVPADAITYYMLQEMAFHRRMAYTMGALWAFSSILRRTNHHMNKKVGRVLSGDTGPQTARLAKVLRGKFEDGIGNHQLKPNAAFSLIGSTASARWAGYYDGWELAVPLSQVLEQALDLDNALLQDRFDQSVVDRADRPPPPPLRIPLRRKLVTRGKAKGASRYTGPAYNPDGGPAYIDIQPDWMQPKSGSRTY